MAVVKVRAGRDVKQAEQANKVSSRNRDNFPNLEFVYAALYAGKIEEEEAKELNPRFQPNKQYGKLAKGKYVNTQGRLYRNHNKGVASLSPSCFEIHAAVEGGHITVEQGKDLNKRYNPEIPRNANRYRSVAKVKYIKESGVGKTPSLVNLHRAYLLGYITEEEATALNSGYDLSNKKRIRYLNSNLTFTDSGYFKVWGEKNKGVIKNDR
jgi:hypothetical protein